MNDFIKGMSILNIEESIYLEIEEKVIEIDSDFILEYNQEEKKVFIYKYNQKNNESISFNDYISIGTIIKDFLINNGIITEKDKKDIFKIEKNYIDTNNNKLNFKELDTKIYKVPENDIVLLKALSMITFNIDINSLKDWLISNKVSYNKIYLNNIEKEFTGTNIFFKLKLEIENKKIIKIFIKSKEKEYIIFE